MKYLLYSFLTVIFLISTIGCAEDTNHKNKGNKQHQSQKDETNSGSEKEEGKHPSERACEFIKTNLSLGLNKQQVTGLLGTNFTEIEAETDVFWRYNIGTGTYETSLQELKLNSSDINAIKGGAVNAILFIQWKEEVVESYNIYYLDDNKTIKELQVTSDGESSKQITLTN